LVANRGEIAVRIIRAARELGLETVQAHSAAAARAGVPTVPGSDGRVERLDDALAALGGDAAAFPVMVKAAAGGGGRGIRIARDRAELERLWAQARMEAQAAFGDGGLYVEKVVERARHVEVQVLGDGAAMVHLLERECSLQRRRQKIWEEAPAVAVPERVRQELRASAARLAAAVGYRGAGTVEYLYDEDTERFHFLEMNTRVQVEHPVTELVTGVDVVRATLEIAGGRPLWLRQEDIRARGHAIEVRINAEDPARDFAPCPGYVGELRVPGGHGVRFDTLLFPGCRVPPFYDSLLGKLIVWDEDRDRALARLRSALRELEVVGVRTTAPLHRALAADPEVARGAVHTRWLEGWLEANTSLLAENRVDQA
jgi:acetyl-CoA carboxylase, biotin carboxylase subunit